MNAPAALVTQKVNSFDRHNNVPPSKPPPERPNKTRQAASHLMTDAQKWRRFAMTELHSLRCLLLRPWFVERALEQYDSRETLRVLALRTTFLLVWGARVDLGFYVAGPQSCSLVRLWTTRSTCCTPTSSQIRSGPAWTQKSHDSPEDLQQQEKLR